MSVLVKCKAHPTYRAIRIPRVACDACELLWELRSGVNVDGLVAVEPR